MAKRKNFGELTDVLEIPDLIGIQLDSYAEFLQMDVASEKRQNKGLEEVFKEVFPIESFDQSCSLDFVSYDLSAANFSGANLAGARLVRCKMS